MRVLLDTHCLLWFLTDDPRLSESALRILQDPDNDVILSMASLWEIAIKSSLKKLDLASGTHSRSSRKLWTSSAMSLVKNDWG